MSAKYIVPTVIAAASLAHAQCSASMGTTTIQNQGDAGAVAQCSTYSGTVAIATGAPASLSFDGQLSMITGDFSAVNAVGVNSITAGNLQTINGNLHLENLTTLTTLSMPQLNAVRQLDWQTLPELQGFDLGNGLETASSINVADTAIQKLDAINVNNAQSISVVNNGYLTSLAWDTNNVTGDFVINGNGQMGLNVSLANLKNAGQIDFSNISSLAVGSLASVSMPLAIQGSTVQTLMFPNLTRSGGVNINNNPDLTNVSFPLLANVANGFGITANDKLGGVLTFPNITFIGGALTVRGAFTGLSMPVINTIRGNSVVVSSQPLGSTCAVWGKKGSVIQAIPTCSSTAQNQGTSNGGSSGGSSGSSSGSGSSQSSSAAKANFAATPATIFGASGLLAAMFGMM